MQGEPLKSRKFGVRNVEIKEHNTETVVTGELGFTLPNRIRKTVGKVKLNLPKADLDLTTDIEQAKERLKSEILSVHMDNENVEEALTRPLPQRFDTARNILDISCKMGTESEIIGVIKVGFDTDGIDIKERIEIWEPLLASASNHVARALRGQGFQERAIKDGLTGLYNKSYMLDSLQAAFERSIESGEDLSLIMIDIDHFKGVNDTYGHMTGDIILKGVAQLMASAARATDIAFRYGGEEMGFILSGQNARKALTLANRVREKVEKAVFTGEKRETISVTISLGVAHHTKDMKSADELLSRADEALYYSKEHGRNQATAWKANNMGSSAK
jgi:diguanylate cyclase (GGDEF)-like protein